MVEEGYVEVQPGLKLYYRWSGTGERVVVTPGIGAWDDDIAPSPGCRHLSYHLRGRGASDKVSNPSDLSVDHDLEDLDSITRHLGLDGFALVGWSYLGVVCAVYAMRNQERVERYIMGGALPPRKNRPSQEIIAQRQAAGEERARFFQTRPTS